MKPRNSRQRMQAASEVMKKKDFDLLVECLKLPPGEERWNFIEDCVSAKGGFDSFTLARLGVKWPPRKGWRSRIVYDGAEQIPDRSTGSPFAEPRLSKLMGERL